MMKKQTLDTPAAAAETPQAATTLSPEAVVDQLRALSVQIGPVMPLTPEQKRELRNQARMSAPVVQASLNVLGAEEYVAQGVGLPAAELREMAEEVNRWTAVEGELRAMLDGVAGANLVRRQRVALYANRAYSLGAQLARDPAHAVLVSHVQEVKRLKRIGRRKKAAQAPDTPAPAPGTTPSSDETSGKQKS